MDTSSKGSITNIGTVFNFDPAYYIRFNDVVTSLKNLGLATETVGFVGAILGSAYAVAIRDGSSHSEAWAFANENVLMTMLPHLATTLQNVGRRAA